MYVNAIFKKLRKNVITRRIFFMKCCSIIEFLDNIMLMLLLGV